MDVFISVSTSLQYAEISRTLSTMHPTYFFGAFDRVSPMAKLWDCNCVVVSHYLFSIIIPPIK